jgi:hypothetical protein
MAFTTLIALDARDWLCCGAVASSVLRMES